MPVFWLVFLLILLAVTGFVLGRAKALQSADGDTRALHSLPGYYGYNVALTALLPTIALLGVWLVAQPLFIENRVSTLIPVALIPDGSSRSLVMSDVRRVAEGLDIAVAQGAMTEDEAAGLVSGESDVRGRLGEVGVALGSDVRTEVLSAAQVYRQMSAAGTVWMTAIVMLAAIGGFAFAYSKTNRDFRARNVVERGVLILLILAASIAIVTTIGIVFSMLFETMNFFSLHSWTDFFFGTTWAPNFRGDSDLSILPLLWGTLYISVIALLVAVPIGLSRWRMRWRICRACAA